MCLTNGNLAGSKLEIKDFTMGSIESEAGHVTVKNAGTEEFFLLCIWDYI